MLQSETYNCVENIYNYDTLYTHGCMNMFKKTEGVFNYCEKPVSMRNNYFCSTCCQYYKKYGKPFNKLTERFKLNPNYYIKQYFENNKKIRDIEANLNNLITDDQYEKGCMRFYNHGFKYCEKRIRMSEYFFCNECRKESHTINMLEEKFLHNSIYIKKYFNNIKKYKHEYNIDNSTNSSNIPDLGRNNEKISDVSTLINLTELYLGNNTPISDVSTLTVNKKNNITRCSEGSNISDKSRSIIQNQESIRNITTTKLFDIITKNNLESLGEDEETNNEELYCTICFVNKKTIKFNCRHICTCVSCTKNLLLDENNNIKEATCPMCRENITSVEKVFI